MTCPATFLAALARLLLLCACMALYLLVPDLVFGLAAWPLVWGIWQRVDPWERPPVSFTLHFLPFFIAVQATLDGLLPFLGDAVILIANVAIVSALRRPKIPKAQAIQRSRVLHARVTASSGSTLLASRT